MPQPISITIAVGCLTFIAIVLAGIMTVGYFTQGEGLWVLVPIAFCGWLMRGLVRRRNGVRIVTRILCLITGVGVGVIWTGAMTIGLAPGLYQFDRLSLFLCLLVAFPLGACWLSFFALGQVAAREYCQSMLE